MRSTDNRILRVSIGTPLPWPALPSLQTTRSLYSKTAGRYRLGPTASSVSGGREGAGGGSAHPHRSQTERCGRLRGYPSHPLFRILPSVLSDFCRAWASGWCGKCFIVCGQGRKLGWLVGWLVGRSQLVRSGHFIRKGMRGLKHSVGQPRDSRYPTSRGLNTSQSVGDQTSTATHHTYHGHITHTRHGARTSTGMRYDNSKVGST